MEIVSLFEIRDQSKCMECPYYATYEVHLDGVTYRFCTAHKNKFVREHESSGDGREKRPDENPTG